MASARETPVKAVRVEASLTDELDVERLNWLRDALGEAKSASLVREALVVYGWAVRQVLEGRRLASVDPEGRPIQEFTTPLLERATWAAWARREPVKVSPEGLKRISRLVEDPPEPTEELRKLMKGKTAAR